MLAIVWLIPLLPLAGFVILTVGGAGLPRKFVSALAVGPCAAAGVVAWVLGTAFVYTRPGGEAYARTLATWFSAGGFHVTYGWYLDALSVVMTTVVTLVASLILLYSVRYMRDDEGYRRFFAYMNLFVASMLILVLADNLLLLYLGWEGVGLCSYLLIGFWYKDPDNCRAAMKAFIVTRLGDVLLLVGLFMLVGRYGTLSIQPIMHQIAQLPTGTAFCTVAALFLLSGAVGKSARLPLQTWLPDAMAGPTPVSALIHAATMVTAGVYLIARTHLLFASVPAVMQVVGAIGTLTLLLAGFSALAQTDIKRVLAYSTISQIGYMFLALGAGAWAAAIYHFITHALFKSALFMGAGVLIMACEGEHNIFKMGGMRKAFPRTFRAFMAASLTLAALPPLTLSFNSKDLILNDVRTSSVAWYGFWVAGVVGAFLTAAYAFRLLYVVFFGDMKTKPQVQPSALMIIPLSVLALLAALSGIPDLLTELFGVKSLYEFLQTALPEPYISLSLPVHAGLMQVFYAAVSLVAFWVTYLMYENNFRRAHRLCQSVVGCVLALFLLGGFGFDWLYSRLLVRPFVWVVRLNRKDLMNGLTDGSVALLRWAQRILSALQNGNLRWYVGGIGLGTMILLSLVIFL